jgi:hypothetical protein
MGPLILQYWNVFSNVKNAVANVAQAKAPTDVWSNFRDQVKGYTSAVRSVIARGQTDIQTPRGRPPAVGTTSRRHQ